LIQRPALRDAEAVGADDHPGMYDGARADGAAGVDHDARVEAAVVADRHALAYHAARADGNAGAEPGALRHDRGRMHAGALRDERVEQLRDAGEIGIGLSATIRGSVVSASASGPRITALARVAARLSRWRLPVKKLMWPDPRLRRAHLAHHGAGIAGHPAAQARNDLPERQRPRHAITSPAACPPRGP